MPDFNSGFGRKATRGGTRLTILIGVVSCFYLGCGGGCGCASRETATPEKGAQSSKSASRPDREAEKIPRKALNLVAVGRDIELGRYDDALKKLKNRINASDKTRYLAALAFQGLEDYKAVASLLSDKVEFTHTELQYKTSILLIDALMKLTRYETAIDELESLIAKDYLSKSERRDLIEKLGDCQLATGAHAKAAANFEQAIKWSGPSRREKLNIKLARALLGENKRKEAAEILVPLALSGKRKNAMNEAYRLLADNELLPDWSHAAQLDRIKQLMTNKSWPEALDAIEKCKGGAGPDIQKELRWLAARILFKRRGHYKEALDALAAVVKDGEPHSGDAQFLSARALSRLDRDKEAIVAFRAFAQSTKKKGRADEAQFYAARLEYYLGRHADALRHFKALVGTGKRRRKTALGGSIVRDAYFLAGMSAFLLERFVEAEEYFEAASLGSGSAAAIERNTYWAALSLFFRKPDTGKPALERICRDDTTSWYALFAGIRLREAGVQSDVCSIVPPALPMPTTGGDTPPDTETAGTNIANAKADTEAVPGSLVDTMTPTVPLSQISSKAALYADLGLYRPAAKALNQVEKSKKVAVKKQDFILHYLALDAPQYAIRNASNGLDWEKRDKDFQWLARTAYPTPYRDLVEKQNKTHSLPPYLIYAIARKESLFDPFAVSYAGAMGMMQMMPRTYEKNRKQTGLPKLTHGALPSPAESIIAGGNELADLLKKFNGSLPLAIMGYNGGSRGVERWLERSGEFDMDVFVEKAGFAQTRNYVRRVYKNLIRYSQLYNAPLPTLPRLATPSAKTASP